MNLYNSYLEFHLNNFIFFSLSYIAVFFSLFFPFSKQQNIDILRDALMQYHFRSTKGNRFENLQFKTHSTNEQQFFAEG
jgi:hypothetical protein